MRDDNEPKPAAPNLEDVRSPEAAKAYVDHMIRSDAAFAKDYLLKPGDPGYHSKDDRPGAREARQRHEYARSLVETVYQRGAAQYPPTQAQVTAREHESIRAEISKIQYSKAYADKSHKEHASAVQAASRLYSKLSGQ